MKKLRKNSIGCILIYERKQQASGAITDFFNSIEYAPNIVRVQVNEVVILDKRPEIQSLAGKKI